MFSDHNILEKRLVTGKKSDRADRENPPIPSLLFSRLILAAMLAFGGLGLGPPADFVPDLPARFAPSAYAADMYVYGGGGGGSGVGGASSGTNGAASSGANGGNGGGACKKRRLSAYRPQKNVCGKKE